jgi:hypothetical protein
MATKAFPYAHHRANHIWGAARALSSSATHHAPPQRQGQGGNWGNFGANFLLFLPSPAPRRLGRKPPAAFQRSCAKWCRAERRKYPFFPAKDVFPLKSAQYRPARGARENRPQRRLALPLQSRCAAPPSAVDSSASYATSAASSL